MAHKDTRYLKERSDGLWLIQVAVPRALRKVIGKPLIEKSLRTQDHGLAIERRDKLLPMIRKAFERILDGQSSDLDFAFVNAVIDIAQRRSEPDAFETSANGEIKFYRRDRRVAQDRTGEWKLLSEMGSRDTKRKRARKR